MLKNIIGENVQKVGNRKFISFLVIAARMLVAAYWKKTLLPSREEWFNKIWYIMLMHKLSVIIKVREGDDYALQGFLETWKKFITFWDVEHPQKNSEYIA